MTNRNQIIRLISLFMLGGPAGFAMISVFLALQTVPAEFADTELISILSAANAVFFAASFAGSSVVATFVSTSQPSENKTFTWYLIRMAVREGSALLGTVVFFIGGTAGQLTHAPYLWANLIPVFALAALTAVEFPTDDRIAEKAKELNR